MCWSTGVTTWNRRPSPVDHGRHGSVLGVQSVLAGPLEGASVAHSYAFGRRRAPRGAEDHGQVGGRHLGGASRAGVVAGRARPRGRCSRREERMPRCLGRPVPLGEVLSHQQVEVTLFPDDDGTTGGRYQGADLFPEGAAYDYRRREGDQCGPGQPCGPSPFRPLRAVLADEAHIGAPTHVRPSQVGGSLQGSGIKVFHRKSGDVVAGVEEPASPSRGRGRGQQLRHGRRGHGDALHNFTRLLAPPVGGHRRAQLYQRPYGSRGPWRARAGFISPTGDGAC